MTEDYINGGHLATLILDDVDCVCISLFGKIDYDSVLESVDNEIKYLGNITRSKFDTPVSWV